MSKTKTTQLMQPQTLKEAKNSIVTASQFKSTLKHDASEDHNLSEQRLDEAQNSDITSPNAGDSTIS